MKGDRVLYIEFYIIGQRDRKIDERMDGGIDRQRYYKQIGSKML
jgi:hypothetical protein